MNFLPEIIFASIFYAFSLIFDSSSLLIYRSFLNFLLDLFLNYYDFIFMSGSIVRTLNFVFGRKTYWLFLRFLSIISSNLSSESISFLSNSSLLFYWIFYSGIFVVWNCPWETNSSLLIFLFDYFRSPFSSLN